MKKLLLTTLLTITGLTLEAMQQVEQQVQEKVPPLYTMIINKVLDESIDKKKLFEELQKYPESIREFVQEKVEKAFIDSFNKGNQIQSNLTPAGTITLFSDGSMRIDNYLGIGHTFYLSNDLQRYMHLDTQGNTVISSLNKELTKSTPARLFSPPVDYYTLAQGIESYHFPYIIISSDADQEHGPFLTIRYPQDLEVEFKARSGKFRFKSQSTEKLPSQYPTLLPTLFQLHTDINDVNKKQIAWHLGFGNQPNERLKLLDANAIKRLVNYILITDNALHRAIKKASTATGQEFEDAKAIIHMLITAGADLEQKNNEGQTAVQLAASNPDLTTVIQQAYARQVLLNAISSANSKTVGQVIAVLGKQGYTLPEFLNTSYETDTPLVYTLKRALNNTDKPQFNNYIAIAQLLINSGATLNNPAGKEFINKYGKEYREKLVPYLTI